MSELVKIAVKDLQGAALDWAVAQVQALAVVWQGSALTLFTKDPDDEQVIFSPSTNWGQARPIIEAEEIELVRAEGSTWKAVLDLMEGDVMVETQFGSTQLEAAMRCVVASEMGDEVEVPAIFVRAISHVQGVGVSNGCLEKLTALVRPHESEDLLTLHLECERNQQSVDQAIQEALLVVLQNDGLLESDATVEDVIERGYDTNGVFDGHIRNEYAELPFCSPAAELASVPQFVRGNSEIYDHSYDEAEKVASSRDGWVLAYSNEPRGFSGRILGVTECHVVQSLGKTAVIHHKSNLDKEVLPNSVVKISYDGLGWGVVAPAVELVSGVGR